MKHVLVGVGIGFTIVVVAFIGMGLASVDESETDERDALANEPGTADAENDNLGGDGSEAVVESVVGALEIVDLRVWREAEFQAGHPDDRHGFLSAVIEHDGGFLAVGSTGGAAGTWWSADGRDWELQDDPGVVLGDPSVGTPEEDHLRMNDVTRLHGDLIAVGFRDERRQSGEAVAWIAPDGGPWERAQVVGPAFADGEEKMSAVAASDDGLVAVGWSGTDAAVWTSADGRRWDRVGHQAAFAGSRSRFMTAVVAGGPGFTAVGAEWDEQADGDGQAMVWTSTDGRVWRQSDSEDLGGAGAQFADGIVAFEDGLVAGGHDKGTGEAAIWGSADGTSWSRVADQPALGGDGEQQIWSLVTAPGGLMAVGADAFADGDLRPAVWLSTDGVSWERVLGMDAMSAGSDASVMLDAAVSEQHATAVGWARQDTGPARTASWFTHPGALPEAPEALAGGDRDEPQPAPEPDDTAAARDAKGTWQATPGFDGYRESRTTNSIPAPLERLVGLPPGMVIESEMRCTRRARSAGVDCTVAEGSVSGQPNEILNGFLAGFDESEWDDVTTSSTSQGGGIIASRGSGPSPSEAFVVSFAEESAGTFNVVISLETYD